MNAVTNKQNRDPTAMRLALLEKDKTRARLAEAEQMLRDGKSIVVIRAEQKAKYGMAAGAGTLMKLRAKIAAEKAKADRKAKRQSKKDAQPKQAEPVVQGLAEGPTRASIAVALLNAGIPFSFDGSTLHIPGVK